MKPALWPLLAAGLCGCQSAMHDVNSSGYRIPSGSHLTLNREVPIPNGQRHAKFQHGNVVSGVNEYQVNCQLRLYDLGAEAVQPDDFAITRSGTGREWQSQPYVMRFYRVLHLKSDKQPNVIKLLCQIWDDPLAGRNISVPQMREALGDYVSFQFPSAPQN